MGDSYEQELTESVTHFKSLLADQARHHWKLIPPSSTSILSDSHSLGKGKARELLNGIGVVEPSSVQVHCRTSRGGDVLRAVAEISVQDGVDLDIFKAILQTPDVREAWDKLVERANSIEILDSQTRITKTDYRLGWPASPRDTVTISKTFCDASTIIDITKSLPRTSTSPAYLNAAPPYVRASIFTAWCIQLLPLVSAATSLPSTSAPTAAPAKARITVFWQWNLKGALFVTQHRQIASLLSDFIDYVREQGTHIPLVSSFGRSLQLGPATTFDQSQDTLNVGYSIVEEEELSVVGVDEVRERRRLERAIEFSLSSMQGWDVKIEMKGVTDTTESSWVAVVESGLNGRLILRISHAKLSSKDQIVRVKVYIQRLAGSKVLKVNGDTKSIITVEPRNLSTLSLNIDDTASILTTSTTASTTPSTSSHSLPSPPSNTQAVDPLIRRRQFMTAFDSLLRRSYIYYTSLLQEPEAKWRHVSDSQGVTVTQLNSIDPTLTIYRAEAKFVGVSMWDVYSTICTPGARAQWDKTLDDAVLVEDVNELSSLWHMKTKAAWPSVPRDSVTIRTTYKSPSSVHVFSFSTDDTNLFPSIPPVVLPTIRTQTDLYGWAIEALSPTTTQITLLDQSDPKGWSNKSWTPAQMINAVAGVGNYAIQFGGPPVVTRLLGAKATMSKYDHDKGMLKVEYRAAAIPSSTGDLGSDEFVRTIDSNSTIECEIRCDCTTWASSIDIIVDPPPAKVSCLSRHRLSSGGGGLWIIVEHDSIMMGEDRILVVIRKGSSSREKGSVTVNGAKAVVDIETIPEDEVKLLAQRKRVKASPIPLDQYSTHIPRIGRTPSPAPTSSTSSASYVKQQFESSSVDLSSSQLTPLVASSPLSNEVPATPIAAIAAPVVSIQSTAPLEPPGHALEALSWLQTFHAEQGPDLADPAPGWSIVSERTGTVVRKKLIPRISESLSVYRGDKIVQGLSADEIANVISSVGCRAAWDDRVDSAVALSSYGQGVSTSVLTTKPVFPFKGRLFHIASVNAQVRVPSAASASSSTSTVLFCASASFPPDGTFDSKRLNPTSLLPGAILLEGWILETLDPYSSSIFAIPSTRLTYVTCIDHSGSVPLALNSVLNGNLARLLNSVEALGKTKGPLPSLQSPSSALQIEGPLSDEDGQDYVWQLTNVDKNSILITSDFEVEDGTFRSLYKVAASPSPSTSAVPAVVNLPAIPASAPVPINGGTILKSELPRSASLTFSSSSPPATPTLIVPSTAGLNRKSSSSSLNKQSRSASPPAPITTTTLVDDVLVTELLIDLKQYRHGYAIICSSSLLSLSSTDPISLEPLRSLAARQIPLRATVHDAPLPPVISASLEATKRKNHLVRILVGTSIVTPSIDDPLRQGRSKSAQPEWYPRFVERGALVDVRIIPLPADPAASMMKNAMRVTFNGERLDVLSQKDSKAVLSKIEDEDWYPNGAKISRVTRKKKASDLNPSLLPVEFERPLAVASRLLSSERDSLAFDDQQFPDSKSGSVTPHELRSPELGASSRRSSGARDASVIAESSTVATGPLQAILGSYPLLRLSSTLMNNTNSTTTPADSTTAAPRRTYSLSTVILVAVIAFLLGSFLRSLLSPSDYILWDSKERTGIEEFIRASFDSTSRNYKEARRIIQIPFLAFDLILVARRNN